MSDSPLRNLKVTVIKKSETSFNISILKIKKREMEGLMGSPKLTELIKAEMGFELRQSGSRIVVLVTEQWKMNITQIFSLLRKIIICR